MNFFFFFRKPSINSDNFHDASSSLHNFTNNKSVPNAFYKCATQYILHGKSLTEMCDHNANVAKSLGKNHVSISHNKINIHIFR